MHRASDPFAHRQKHGAIGAIVPNGVDARRGGYFTPADEWVERALAAVPGIAAIRRWVRQIREGDRELVDGRSPERLAEAGWGVVFAESTDPRVREALADLLQRRRSQADAGEPLYREFAGSDGVRAGESKDQFLARHGAGPGAVDPRKVPYYLLLMGGPDEIPMSFQYQLDVRRAVGRLHFEPRDDDGHLENYRCYVRSLLAAEDAPPPTRPRRLALFGPRNPDDWCTEETSRHLVRELGGELRQQLPTWQIDTYEAEQATKPRLQRLVGGSDTPDLLLCACHGLLYGPDDPLLRSRQGALVCQEWPGPRRSSGEVPRDCFVAAEDLAADADLGGLVAFFFSCFGAATSRFDESNHAPVEKQKPRAPASFLARLPSQLLSQPAGAAAAVVAHVDQAFPHYNGATQRPTYLDLLARLAAGSTIGWAMELLNRRYAELASDLHDLQERLEGRQGVPAEGQLLFDLWTATNDSRGFVVLGDPAARMGGAWRNGDAG